MKLVIQVNDFLLLLVSFFCKKEFGKIAHFPCELLRNMLSLNTPKSLPVFVCTRPGLVGVKWPKFVHKIGFDCKIVTDAISVMMISQM